MAPVTANQDIKSFGRSCNQSSSCLDLQNQRNDHGARQEHSLSSSIQKNQLHEQIVTHVPGSGCNKNPNLPGAMIMQNSGDSTLSQGPDLSAGSADGNDNVVASAESLSMSCSRGVEVSPMLSLGSSSIRIDNSSGVPANIVPQDDGNLRQISEFGSSRGPRQANITTLNNHSHNFNSTSSTRLPTSLLNPPHAGFQEHPVLRTRVGQHANSVLVPGLYTNTSSARPQGNCNSGISQHNSVQLNSLTTMNVPMQHFSPRQSFVPMWLNELSVRSSSPYTGMMPPPHVYAPPLAPFIHLNPMVDISTLRQQGPEIRSLAQQSRQQPAIENVGSPGDLSTHQTNYHSSLHQWPADLPWATHPAHAAIIQQIAAEHLPWFVPPWYGSQSGAQYLNFAPSPHPPAYGYPPDLLLEPGPSTIGQSPYFHGPLVSQSGHDLQTLQTVRAQADGQNMIPYAAAHTDWEDDINSEAMRLMHQNYLLYGTLLHPAMIYLHDRYSEMRLDVGIMSYEELLALGDHIGSVRAGLREGKIRELLKRRVYDRGTCEPSADPETCCICIEEYASGEEIGTLNCGHEFHAGCIKQWLIVKNECPNCKKKGLGP